MPEISVSVAGMAAATRRLNGIIDHLEDLDDALEAIGEYMVNSTRTRIYRDHRSPDGEPWAPLAEGTIKKKGHARPLYVTGTLANSVQVLEYDDGGVIVGTDDSSSPYAEYMQEGFWHVRARRHIPARPFLGISDTNIARIRRILLDHIMEANR